LYEFIETKRDMRNIWEKWQQERGGEEVYTLKVLFQGLVYQFWQQNELAREYFSRAIQVAEQHGHILEQAEPNRHLTFDALFRGDLEAALTHARRALSFREAAGFRPYQPFDHLALWDIYRKKGDMDNAQFHMQQASALAEEMGLSTLVSSVINTTNRLETQKEEG
jgi:tetratricopeptide (TPR) repeat protein